MQKNFPDYIRNEKDLEIYERYLRNISTGANDNGMNTSNFKPCLKNAIGKLVKVESLIGNRMMSRMGILFEVGEEHIVIKRGRVAVTTVIPMDTVKYITVIHNNDYNHYRMSSGRY